MAAVSGRLQDRPTLQLTADNHLTSGINAVHQAAGAAANFMARADGPRVGALAFDGWDTHQDMAACPFC